LERKEQSCSLLLQGDGPLLPRREDPEEAGTLPFQRVPQSLLIPLKLDAETVDRREDLRKEAILLEGYRVDPLARTERYTAPSLKVLVGIPVPCIRRAYTSYSTRSSRVREDL
jgi:hypothetical protein